IVAGGIHEDSDRHRAASDRIAHGKRRIEVQIARAWGVEIQSDHVGARKDCGFDILRPGHPADLNANGHREAAASGAGSAPISSESLAAGLPPRSRLSPIRKPPAPARSSRTMSEGLSIPLSETTRDESLRPARSFSVTAISVTKVW